MNYKIKNSFKLYGLKFIIECKILGACLNEESAFKRIVNLVNASNFQDRNYSIFEAMSELYYDRLPIDLISVSKQIVSQLAITKMDEENKYLYLNKYLISLSKSSNNSYNIEYHALTLCELCLRESLIDELTKMIQLKKCGNIELIEDAILFLNTLLQSNSDPLYLLEVLISHLKLNYPHESEKYQALLDVENDFTKQCFQLKQNLPDYLKRKEEKKSNTSITINDKIEKWPIIDCLSKRNIDILEISIKSNMEVENKPENDLPF